MFFISSLLPPSLSLSFWSDRLYENQIHFRRNAIYFRGLWKICSRISPRAQKSQKTENFWRKLKYLKPVFQPHSLAALQISKSEARIVYRIYMIFKISSKLIFFFLFASSLSLMTCQIFCQIQKEKKSEGVSLQIYPGRKGRLGGEEVWNV